MHPGVLNQNWVSYNIYTRNLKWKLLVQDQWVSHRSALQWERTPRLCCFYLKENFKNGKENFQPPGYRRASAKTTKIVIFLTQKKNWHFLSTFCVNFLIGDVNFLTGDVFCLLFFVLLLAACYFFLLLCCLLFFSAALLLAIFLVLLAACWLLFFLLFAAAC